MFDAELLVRDLVSFHNVVYIVKYNVKAFFCCGVPEIASIQKRRPVCVPVIAGELTWQEGKCWGKRQLDLHVLKPLVFGCSADLDCVTVRVTLEPGGDLTL